MALVTPDRVKETSTTTGTGTFTLAGAVETFQSFSAVGDGNTTYYVIQHSSADEFEVGIGTYTASGTTLSRDTVLTSSNSGSKVNFSAGDKEVFVSIPSAKTVAEDDSNNIAVAGTLTVGADPTSALQVATKEYVDSVASAAIHLHEEVRLEVQSNLSATYDNGTNGVGATLTNSGTQAAFSADGVTASLNDRILVDKQTDQTQNGVYTVTTLGSGSTNWVLTRSTDTDSSGDGDPNTLDEGAYFYVQEGNVSAGHSYVCNTPGTIVFGTTNITFAEFFTSPEFTAGTNIDITNRVISVTGTVADSSLLDGLDSTQFLRSDAADTKSSGNLTFSDSVRAVFGDSLDLQVYHSGGTINHIVGLAGHSTYITGGTDLYLRGVNGEEGVTVNGNGAVELFHNNEKKLETSSSGVSITGTATATSFTGNLTGDVTGNADTATAWETSRSLSLSGDVTGTATGIDGSGNISVTTTIGANSVALGTDTTGNYVASLVAGAAIDLQNNSGEGATPTIDVDLSELSTSTTNGDGDYFVVVDTANAQRKLTKGNIAISGFNNDSGFTSNAGTVTSVTVSAGNGLTGGGTITSSGTATLNVGAGTGVSVAANSISIGQAVGTSSNVRFNSLGIGTNASGTAGEIRATNDITAFYSDNRLKDIEGKIDNALDKVKSLGGYYFYENEVAKSLGYENDKRQVGVIAQEVEAMLPEAVKPAPIDDKYLTVQYEKLVPLLIEAIKELEARVSELEK